uniref:(northern house mosquito) hypothetical protein n=1 Tax=Culex pipiens TaxID=7175 RepID=A0A8D8ABK7_CULPI
MMTTVTESATNAAQETSSNRTEICNRFRLPRTARTLSRGNRQPPPTGSEEAPKHTVTHAHDDGRGICHDCLPERPKLPDAQQLPPTYTTTTFDSCKISCLPKLRCENYCV